MFFLFGLRVENFKDPIKLLKFLCHKKRLNYVKPRKLNQPEHLVLQETKYTFLKFIIGF